MMTVGELEIKLFANLAQLSKDMDEAKSTVEHAMKGIESATELAKRGIELFGIGLGGHELVEFVNRTIEAEAHLHNLTYATGLTAEQLSGLSVLAKYSDISIDMLSKSLTRMSVSVGKNPERFQQLGITAKDAMGQFKQFADLFNSLEDIDQRNAVAQEVFNRNWQQLAPALAKGSEGIDEVVNKASALSGVTSESALAANEFKDKLNLLGASASGAGTDIVNVLLPPMNEVVDALQKASEDKTFREFLVGTTLGVTEFARVVVIGLKTIILVVEELGVTLNTAGLQLLAFTQLRWGDINKIGADGLAEMARVKNQYMKDVAEMASHSFVFGNTQPSAPEIKDKSVSDAAAERAAAFLESQRQQGAASKRLLDARLQALERNIKDEESALANRNTMLDMYYNQNSISIKDYFSYKNAVEDMAYNSTIKNYKNEIRAEQDYVSGLDAGTVSIADAQAAQQKIYEIQAKIKKENADHSLKGIVNALKEDEANKQFQNSLQKLNEQYLTMNGLKEESAAISFDLSNQQLKEKLTTEQLYGELGKLAELRERTLQNASTKGEDGFILSMRNYATAANDASTQIEGAMTNAFKGMENALVDFVTKGKIDFKSLTDAIVADMIRMAIRQSITGPLAGSLGNLFVGKAYLSASDNAQAQAFVDAQSNANGGVYSGGISAYSGQIIDHPTMFKFAHGVGLMGESGAEAIMPIGQTSSGVLGVHAILGGGGGGGGGGDINVTYAPVYHIDSRTDRAEILNTVDGMVKQGQNQLVDTLIRQRRLR